MFKPGAIIPSNGPKGEEYYVVIEGGRRPLLELLDDFIMRNYVVRDQDGGFCTIKEIVDREKSFIISRGEADV